MVVCKVLNSILVTTWSLGITGEGPSLLPLHCKRPPANAIGPTKSNTANLWPQISKHCCEWGRGEEGEGKVKTMGEWNGMRGWLTRGRKKGRKRGREQEGKRKWETQRGPEGTKLPIPLSGGLLVSPSPTAGIEPRVSHVTGNTLPQSYILARNN